MVNGQMIRKWLNFNLFFFTIPLVVKSCSQWSCREKQLGFQLGISGCAGVQVQQRLCRNSQIPQIVQQRLYSKDFSWFLGWFVSKTSYFQFFVLGVIFGLVSRYWYVYFRSQWCTVMWTMNFFSYGFNILFQLKKITLDFWPLLVGFGVISGLVSRYWYVYLRSRGCS